MRQQRRIVFVYFQVCLFDFLKMRCQYVMIFAETPRLTLLLSLLAGVLASPLQVASSTTLTQSSPAPIPYSLLGPPKPVAPPNPVPPVPVPVDPVCPPTLGKPPVSDCLAAAALIPRDPRQSPILRNFYVRESDRNVSMENVKLPYERTVG